MKWELTDSWLFILTCIGILQMAVSDNGLYRFICGACLLGLAFTMMRRMHRWKYRAIGTRLMYEGLVKGLEEHNLKVVSTCRICQQDVTDREEHMRKVHGWSPRPR